MTLGDLSDTLFNYLQDKHRDKIQFYFGHRLTGISVDNKDLIFENSTGRESYHAMRVLGCDGSHSLVRRELATSRTVVKSWKGSYRFLASKF